MNLQQKLIAVLCLCFFLSCSNDDEIFTAPPINTLKQTNIYPKPPSGWMGETNPYNTTGWVGDIMPYFENGVFHLYFLHDAMSKPEGKGFHDIHSFETTDFTEFNYKGRMIPYGEADEPDFGVGTGSIVEVEGVYYFYYTGHNGIPSFLQNNPRESVLCATSTDLKNWTKVEDFKLTAPSGYYDYDFRDPHVFYNQDAGEYWMLMSTQTEPGRKAVVALFTTTDPASNNWTVQSPVYTTTFLENYLMLECADMFKMGDYWYLVFSENWSNYTGTRYRMATSPNGPWITPENDRFDGEYFYAAKTASDGNSRYLFGWTARKFPENNTGNKEWAGNMVIHKLDQNNDGTLSVVQPESIAKVFENEEIITVEGTSGNVEQNDDVFMLNGTSGTSMAVFSNLNKTNQINFSLKAKSSGNSGVVLNYSESGSMGFKIAFEKENNRVVAYSVTDGNNQYLNHVPFSYSTDETIQVTVNINEDVCVVYIDDEIAMSNRLYGTNKKQWALYSENADVEFSNLSLKTPN